MDKDHHRRGPGDARWREDIEDEAVLALLEGIAWDIGTERGRRLGGGRSELAGVAHARPVIWRHWAAEPQVARGRRGVRDAEELEDAVVLAPFYEARRDDDRLLLHSPSDATQQNVGGR